MPLAQHTMQTHCIHCTPDGRSMASRRQLQRPRETTSRTNGTSATGHSVHDICRNATPQLYGVAQQFAYVCAITVSRTTRWMHTWKRTSKWSAIRTVRIML